MSDISIAKCRIEDLPRLQKIAIETFRHTYESKNDPIHFEKYLIDSFSEKRLRSELNNSYSHFYFVKTEDKIAGYFKINEPDGQSDLNRKGSIEIERIYLLEEFKGRGLGRKMIDFCKSFAKEKGFLEIWLGVWEENPAAINFYKKTGFETFGTHIFTIGNDDQKDFLLRFPIS